MEIDARGLRCPLPRIKLELALRQVEPEAKITLLSDDPEAPLDIAAWCADHGHQIFDEKSSDSSWIAEIRKAADS